LIAATFFSQHGRVAASDAVLRRNSGQPGAKAFEWVVPECFAGERIKTEDFPATGRQKHSLLKRNVDKIRAFETCCPHLLAGGAIERDDRSFDADKNQF